ncbi:MAG: hypothetical protein HQK97_04570 [Nitrospirae bacterium]|nr:hypothetical protein [Nitrospirota bacterium]
MSIQIIRYLTYDRISNIREALEQANQKYFDELDFGFDASTAEGQVAQQLASASNCLDCALFMLKRI